MSWKSSFLRGVYGVEKRPRIAKSKHAFYREQRAGRGDVLRRAQTDYLKHKSNLRPLVRELNAEREQGDVEWAVN